MGNEAPIEVKRAMVEDMEMILDLTKQAHKDAGWERTFGPYDRESMRATYAQRMPADVMGCFVAENGEGPLGLTVVSIVPLYFCPAHKLAHLMTVWVDKKKRGNGAGKILIDAAEEWAKKMGAMALMTETLQPNRKKISQLYRSLGYRQYQTSFLKRFSHGH